MHCQVTFMTLSYFAVMLMFDTFCSFFWCYVKKRNKFLITDFPVCLLPALECLNGRMDETLCFLLPERQGKFLFLFPATLDRLRMSSEVFSNKFIAVWLLTKILTCTVCRNTWPTDIINNFTFSFWQQKAQSFIHSAIQTF